MQEVWKELQGYRETYLVSNLGNVKTKERVGCRGNIVKSHTMKKFINDNGYQRVMLSLNGCGGKYYYIHRLVANLFIENPCNKEFINHKDGNKANNQVDNLEWCTRSENEKHAWRNGLKNLHTVGTKGEKHGMHKLSQKDVDYIRSVHKRFDAKFGSKALAIKFKVSPQTITNIVNNRNWKK